MDAHIVAAMLPTPFEPSDLSGLVTMASALALILHASVVRDPAMMQNALKAGAEAMSRLRDPACDNIVAVRDELATAMAAGKTVLVLASMRHAATGEMG